MPVSTDKLREVRDWALFQERVWGEPLSVYVCVGTGDSRCEGGLECDGCQILSSDERGPTEDIAERMNRRH